MAMVYLFANIIIFVAFLINSEKNVKNILNSYSNTGIKGQKMRANGGKCENI